MNSKRTEKTIFWNSSKKFPIWSTCIIYVRKNPKGLGHAIHCAKTFTGNEPFAVLLGDDVVVSQEKPALKQLMDVYEEYQTTIPRRSAGQSPGCG